MLNVQNSPLKPLTDRGKMAIIHFVSIRSLAPGNDMIAKVLTTPGAKALICIAGESPWRFAAGDAPAIEIGGKYS